MGKLRLLIDRLNTLPSLPPAEKVAASDTQDQRPDRGVGEIAEEESMRIVEPGT
jgi:hypothetical protein